MEKLPVDKEKFVRIFNDWLAKHNHNGAFYKNDKGWFIMSGGKKIMMPALFQNYQELTKEDVT